MRHRETPSIHAAICAIRQQKSCLTLNFPIDINTLFIHNAHYESDKL